jgi:phospholipid/cholesterol/gamma-HCH transport system substrate-binding protein
MVALAAAGLLALSGCSFKGAYSLPLPGGAAHGKTYHVSAIFSDVQDLTVQAAVRVNDVAVGDVTSINLDTTKGSPGYLKANVGMSINQSVRLPANAIATLEQTTLLGEKFVSLSPPLGAAPTGTLANDAVINNGSSSELPSVEEVFGLLSQVLNGSDLADLQTINVEVSKALAGRESEVKGALTQLNTFVAGLNSQKHEIVRALVELNRFSSELAAQDGTIATALTDLGPGLRVLADERAEFTSLLTHLSTFGHVATHVINASRTATITDLRQLQPVLDHLSAAGKDLPRSLEILVTFPFPRDSSQASPGDYTNFQADINLTPIICQAEANLGGIPVTDLPLVNQILGGGSCPTASVPTLPLTSKGHPKTSTGRSHGHGTTSGSAPGGTSPAPSSPTPSPSSSGLAQLLNGLGGGN